MEPTWLHHQQRAIQMRRNKVKQSTIWLSCGIQSMTITNRIEEQPEWIPDLTENMFDPFYNKDRICIASPQ